MTEIFVKPFVQGDRQLLYAADLLNDAELRRSAGRIESANGGVEFLTQDSLILVDDIFDVVARALLRDGAAELRDGESVLYRHRLSGDVLEIAVNAGTAVIDPDGPDEITLPVETLAEAMDTAWAEVEQLLALESG